MRKRKREKKKRITLKRLVLASFLLLLFSFIGTLVYYNIAIPGKEVHTSFGTSHLDHRAFFEFLKAMKINVQRLRCGEPGSIPYPVFFIEPSAYTKAGKKRLRLKRIIRERLERGLYTILVLPKWERRPGGYKLIPKKEIENMLTTVLPVHFLASPKITRKKRAGKTKGWEEFDGLFLDLPFPQSLDPEGRGRVLLGREGEAYAIILRERLVIVSDPDLLHNFNIQKGDNAFFWRLLIRNCILSNRVIIDEIFHGLYKERSLQALLGSMPGILVSVHLVLLSLALLMAGFYRFHPGEKEKPPLGRSPLEMVGTGGILLGRGTGIIALANDYAEKLVMRSAEKIGMKEFRDGKTAAEFLDRIGERKGLEPIASSLLSSLEKPSTWKHQGVSYDLVSRLWIYNNKVLEAWRKVGRHGN